MPNITQLDALQMEIDRIETEYKLEMDAFKEQNRKAFQGMWSIFQGQAKKIESLILTIERLQKEKV